MVPIDLSTLEIHTTEVDHTRQLQLKDFDFLERLQGPALSKSDQEERISMVNGLIGVSQIGIEVVHKEAETATTAYECARIMAQDTVRMMKRGQAHGDGWEQLSNQWQNLKTFTEHLGRYLAPVLSGINTEIDTFSEARRQKQLPQALKDLIAQI
ncbi:MAG: hypothetical protein SGJ02_04455 [bacterium]|nr:hypothetical protein [bacterium]